jgi:EpsI family protein
MKAFTRVAVSVILLAGTLLLLSIRSSGEAVPIRRPLDRFPAALGMWEEREKSTLEPKIIRNLKLNDYLVRRYVDPAGRSLWVYIGYWETQRKNAQIHSPRNCLPGHGWEPLEASRVTVSLPAPDGSITVNRYLIQKEQDQQIVFYWYQSQGRAIPGEIEARISMIRNAAARNRTDGALVRISSPVYGSVAETTTALAAYVQTIYPVLRDFLPD